MGLKENLKLGITVANRVRLEVPKSSNAGYTSSYIKTGSGKIVNEVASVASVRPPEYSTRPTIPSDWLERFEGVCKLCKKEKMGNCGELAAIACLYLRELKAYPVDYVEIADGITTKNPAIPHNVAVIGRTVAPGPQTWPADGTPIGLPDTWHPDAVICDPWDRVVYPAHEYDEYWDGLREHSIAPKMLTCTLVHQL